MSDDSTFEHAWFKDAQIHNMTEHFSEIRTFAYLVFDQLDTNHNSFIEIDELAGTLNSALFNEREKSFISFLINNHDAIVESNDEANPECPEGISRANIEAYFELISNLL